MTTLQEAAQMALEWADSNGEAVFAVGGWDAVSALNKWSQPLRAALAQPKPKLVLWNFKYNRLAGPSDDSAEVAVIRQREWQGLTDEDLSVCDEDGVILARYWEAKLREKNS